MLYLIWMGCYKWDMLQGMGRYKRGMHQGSMYAGPPQGALFYPALWSGGRFLLMGIIQLLPIVKVFLCGKEICIQNVVKFCHYMLRDCERIVEWNIKDYLVVNVIFWHMLMLFLNKCPSRSQQGGSVSAHFGSILLNILATNFYSIMLLEMNACVYSLAS